MTRALVVVQRPLVEQEPSRRQVSDKSAGTPRRLPQAAKSTGLTGIDTICAMSTIGMAGSTTSGLGKHPGIGKCIDQENGKTAIEYGKTANRWMNSLVTVKFALSCICSCFCSTSIIACRLM